MSACVRLFAMRRHSSQAPSPDPPGARRALPLRSGQRRARRGSTTQAGAGACGTGTYRVTDSLGPSGPFWVRAKRARGEDGSRQAPRTLIREQRQPGGALVDVLDGGPLVAAHGARRVIGEQIEEDVIGGEGEELSARHLDRPEPLLARGQPDRLDVRRARACRAKHRQPPAGGFPSGGVGEHSDREGVLTCRRPVTLTVQLASESVQGQATVSGARDGLAPVARACAARVARTESLAVHRPPWGVLTRASGELCAPDVSRRVSGWSLAAPYLASAP